MFEVEPIGRHGRTASQNGDDDATGTASEAFARRLHHRYAPVELLSVGDFVSLRDTLLS